MSCRTFRPLAGLFLLTALVASALAQQAAPAKAKANAKLRDFVHVGRFMVEIDGAPAKDAQIYQSAEAQAYLIRSPLLEDAAVLRLQGTQVQALPEKHLHATGEWAKVGEDYQAETVGQFRLGRTSLEFSFEGHDLRMMAKPDLEGFIESSDIEDYDAIWGNRAQAYTPDPRQLQAIRSKGGGDVRIVTYFGSWCPHCQKKVPFMMRIEEKLNGSGIDFSYYGVPRPPRFGRDPEAVKHKIESVPTAIVYINGEEAGRLVSDDWEKPEEKFARILK